MEQEQREAEARRREEDRARPPTTGYYVDETLAGVQVGTPAPTTSSLRCDAVWPRSAARFRSPNQAGSQYCSG